MAKAESGVRLESDGLGQVEVPAGRYWGAQTQRSLKNFAIGRERMPMEVISALAILKKACAMANRDIGQLGAKEAGLILAAADEVTAGKLDEHFPLGVWVGGSGTPCNMNVNEVIANRAIELAGGRMGSKSPVHPNDHVNMSQSTNDVFPSAMLVASAKAIKEHLIPALAGLGRDLGEKARDWAGVAKIGRTHMMDAVPMTLGQEFSGYAGLIEDNLERLAGVFPGLCRLPLGGTAVGTGLNAPKGFARAAVAHAADLTGLTFVPAPNRFAAQGSHDALVMASGVLRTVAVSLYKLAMDIKLLGSGPNCGLGDLILPANEPGSSIMPGKVNPTQCEAVTMVAAQVMGLDAAVALAGAGGQLEMNAAKPLIIRNVLECVRLLSDACLSFSRRVLAGLAPNKARMDLHLSRSLMLVTALNPVIGYDKAGEIAKLAGREDLSLKEAALRLGYLTAEDFDRLVDPVKLANPES